MRFILILIFFSSLLLNAQTPEEPQDSLIVLGDLKIMATKQKMQTDLKMAITVDEFLASSDNISFVKRGAYAWEPMLNNMSSERSTVTIDGMRVFGACTDKMDPITTYVESNNLSNIEIKSGQEGSMHGATVSGSIDLKRKNTPFGIGKTWKKSYQAGFEFNNKQFFNLGDVSYASDKFVADASISYRNAQNYFDGNDKEVEHSQFKKFNTSLGLAYKISPLSSIRVDAIFDKAKDVGYPALPMDLSLSRALITSATYKQMFEKGLIRVLDTKFYFNAIEHYMDDTTRPENLVHMDMPGWSTTYGLLSKANIKKDKFSSEIQLNAYSNLSIAEMTMYPQDRSQRTMFAYTWPWVTTVYGGLSINNALELSERSQVNFGGSLGMNYNHSKYAEFNWIFYPGSPQEKYRLLPSLHTSYNHSIGDFDFTTGVGYGQRAPSISEAYGYYIYNSFDRYDYIGNPNLSNEVSYEVNAAAGYKKRRFGIQAKANYFFIENYIVGKILSLGSPMNYQSVGVKGYTALDHVKLFNFSLNTNYTIARGLHWKGSLTYARAQGADGKNLPFIRPLSYQTSLHYGRYDFDVQTTLRGDLEQTNYSPVYGEDATPAYMVWDISANYRFDLFNLRPTIQVGAENILNQYYSTYADWGNIPRMGRNIFTSIKFNF